MDDFPSLGLRRRIRRFPVRALIDKTSAIIDFLNPVNIHHLELFYYVARHGGISAAVRHMPYGIQQPAVSAQLIQLEDYLGTALFQRRPFSLTAAGEELYTFIRPFFEGLGPLAEKIRGGSEHQLRLGAVEIIQREYLPAFMRRLRAHFPRLAFSLMEGSTQRLEQALLAQEIDLGIGVLDGKPAPGLHATALITLPLVLLVPRASRLRDAGELWKQDRIAEPLVTIPGAAGPFRHFHRELERRKIVWPVSLELNSLDLVARYVEEGFGIGLSIRTPGVPLSRRLRVLPLEGFAPLSVGAMWSVPLTPFKRACLHELEAMAAELQAPVGAD
ncbi:MAG: LysR family transcriptional regulator [Chthoniobacteraceae bacterium]